MNKSELIDALATYFDGSKAEATRALNVFVHTVSAATAAGERVAITGFGVFERVERPARTVRNPRTGERLDVAATAVPRFRAGTELKAYVSGQRTVPDLVVAPLPRRTPAAAAPVAAPVAQPAAEAAPPLAEPVAAPTSKNEVKAAKPAKPAKDVKKKDSGKKASKKSASKKDEPKKSAKKGKSKKK